MIWQLSRTVSDWHLPCLAPCRYPLAPFFKFYLNIWNGFFWWFFFFKSTFSYLLLLARVFLFCRPIMQFKTPPQTAMRIISSNPMTTSLIWSEVCRTLWQSTFRLQFNCVLILLPPPPPLERVFCSCYRVVRLAVVLVQVFLTTKETTTIAIESFLAFTLTRRHCSSRP